MSKTLIRTWLLWLFVPPVCFGHPGPAALEALSSPVRLLGETAVTGDFDGDQKRDLIVARWRGGHFELEIFLSSKPGVTVLRPPVPLTEFTVHACDINRDSFDDIVITTPAAKRPVAVWLGDGNGSFRTVPGDLFPDGAGLTEPSRCESRRLPPDQDSAGETRYPASQAAPGFRHTELDPGPFWAGFRHSAALRKCHSPLTLRSPPAGAVV